MTRTPSPLDLCRKVDGLLRLSCHLLVVAAVAGCNHKTQSASGEVILLLSTDMQVPNDFDSITLKVGAGPTRLYVAPNAELASSPDPDCSSNDKERTNDLSFPTSIALLSQHDDATSVRATLKACRAGHAIFSREFAVNLPTRGEVKMVRVPIRWLCTHLEQECFGCSSSVPNHVGPALDCHHEEIVQLAETDSRCKTAACESDSADAFGTIEYADDEIARYNGTWTAKDGCFDPWDAFDVADESQFVRRAWFSVPTFRDASTGACMAALDVRDNAWLNLALVLPPESSGFCGKYRCLVPLEPLSPVGWLAPDPGRFLLPDAVCSLLDSGQILYLIGTQKLARKGAQVPLCGGNAKPTIATATADSILPLNRSAEIYLPLDESVAAAPKWLVNDRGEAVAQRVDSAETPPRDMSSDVAVVGRAGVFNSTQYAKGSSGTWMAPPYTLAVWVSLTELAENDPTASGTDRMPIASNVSTTCQSGARLELRTCAAQSKIVLALGIPSPSPSTPGLCNFEYHYAPLSAKSYTGGFFTPWQSGTYYHVAVTQPLDGIPTFYVDGEEVAAGDSGCGFAPTVTEPDDASAFYLGTSMPAILAGTRTHDLRLDEFLAFADTLTDVQIQRLFLQSRTTPGASGLRWYAWATKGTLGTQVSTATLVAKTPFPEFHVDDAAFSVAGSAAQLGVPLDVEELEGTSKQRVDLSEYNEAVLVASLPPSRTFQFALMAEHGRRQCTWQLISNPGSTKNPNVGAESYIIDLSRPSWCNDPLCQFQLAQIDSVTIGSDWKEQQSAFVYTVKSLAFRRHGVGVVEPDGTLDSLGGMRDVNRRCWKSIVYDPKWEVASVQRLGAEGGTDSFEFSEPPILHNLSNVTGTPNYPELAADLPELAEHPGARDLTACKRITLCLTLGGPNGGAQDDSRLVLQNEVGQTWTWALVGNYQPDPAQTSLSIAHHASGWPSDTWTDDFLQSITRVSVRHPGTIRVGCFQCCTDTVDAASCADLQ